VHFGSREDKPDSSLRYSMYDSGPANKWVRTPKQIIMGSPMVTGAVFS